MAAQPSAASSPGIASLSKQCSQASTPASKSSNRGRDTAAGSTASTPISWPLSQRDPVSAREPVWPATSYDRQSTGNGSESDTAAEELWSDSSEDCDSTSGWDTSGTERRAPRVEGIPGSRENDVARSSNKNTKASLLVASENVRGRGAQQVRGSMKWKKISTDMMRERIGVMAIQETHLSPEHADEIAQLYPRLHLVNTADPGNPTGAGGVALVFNKLLTNYETVRSAVLVEGRVIAACFEWHRGRSLTVLAVYAPTERVDNHNMWEEVREKLESEEWNLGTPELVLGDFNFVEDEVDRFPAAFTRMDRPASFTNLKRHLRIRDGWRSTNPSATEWTWRDATRAHMSRINRIYMTDRLLVCSTDWDISISGITRNDHSRVQVRLYALDGPEVGKGRWSMGVSLTKDETFLKTVNALALLRSSRLLHLKPLDR